MLHKDILEHWVVKKWVFFLFVLCGCSPEKWKIQGDFLHKFWKLEMDNFSAFLPSVCISIESDIYEVETKQSLLTITKTSSYHHQTPPYWILHYTECNKIKCTCVSKKRQFSK